MTALANALRDLELQIPHKSVTAVMVEILQTYEKLSYTPAAVHKWQTGKTETTIDDTPMRWATALLYFGGQRTELDLEEAGVDREMLENAEEAFKAYDMRQVCEMGRPESEAMAAIRKLGRSGLSYGWGLHHWMQEGLLVMAKLHDHEKMVVHTWASDDLLDEATALQREGRVDEALERVAAAKQQAHWAIESCLKLADRTENEVFVTYSQKAEAFSRYFVLTGENVHAAQDAHEECLEQSGVPEALFDYVLFAKRDGVDRARAAKVVKKYLKTCGAAEEADLRLRLSSRPYTKASEMLGILCRKTRTIKSSLAAAVLLAVSAAVALVFSAQGVVGSEVTARGTFKSVPPEKEKVQQTCIEDEVPAHVG